MGGKSFYDLDYIIELNEKRLEQYSTAYQKVLERFATLILIYSGLTIFMIPIVQDIEAGSVDHWLMKLTFGLYCTLFGLSLFFTVRLIIPVEIAYLKEPSHYYKHKRKLYEHFYVDPNEISILLKSSYVAAQEKALAINYAILRSKRSFYYKALMIALFATAPYLVSISFHILQKRGRPDKVLIIHPEVDSILHKIDSMFFLKKKTKEQHKEEESITFGTATELPGIDSNKVIDTFPILIREDHATPSNKTKQWWSERLSAVK